MLTNYLDDADYEQEQENQDERVNSQVERSRFEEDYENYLLQKSRTKKPAQAALQSQSQFQSPRVSSQYQGSRRPSAEMHTIKGNLHLL